MYLTFFIVATLINFCQNWVLNDVHHRSFNKSSHLYEEDVDLSNLSAEDFARSGFSLIFPGTKWCGPGDIAENHDDLGELVEEDKCCREHDYCTDTISAGETKYNLTNEASYTRLSCGCDEKFRKCMLNVNTKPSEIIGDIYFNLIRTKCFRKDYPVTGCLKKGGIFQLKCIKHSYDTNGQPRHQWFDVPDYHD